jgi:hypothetical protein
MRMPDSIAGVKHVSRERFFRLVPEWSSNFHPPGRRH